jgi:hypothetical protein
MYYQTESNIRNFRAWAGGASWQKVVLNSSEDIIDYVELLLDELFTEDSHATETDVNDFLCFDLSDHMDENGYTYDPISDSFIENEED